MLVFDVDRSLVEAEQALLSLQVLDKDGDQRAAFGLHFSCTIRRCTSAPPPPFAPFISRSTSPHFAQ